LAQIFQDPEVQVGQEVNEGFLRVYYVNESNIKIFVSPENQNSKHAVADGEYVVWVTEINDMPGQIFLHHIPSSTTTQLTASGTNLKPEIENGLVVWEGWAPSASSGQATWQVFLYDGTGVRQLTSGDLSINPDIEGDNIIMARRDSAGTWRSSLYSLLDGSFADISTGPETKHPKLDKKKIFHGDEEFALITDDIYLLGFDVVPEEDEDAPITEEDILEEIFGPDATISAQLNEEPLETESATESAELRQSSPSADLTSPPSN